MCVIYVQWMESLSECEMGVSLNVVCTAVEPRVCWLLRERRRKVGTHTENLVGYNIKVSGMWTEHLKCDFM